MLAAIDLDDEPSLKTGEVHDIRPEWDLTAEAMALELPPTQPRPKSYFSLGWIAAQSAGIAPQNEVILDDLGIPLPIPPTQGGRG